MGGWGGTRARRPRVCDGVTAVTAASGPRAPSGTFRQLTAVCPFARRCVLHRHTVVPVESLRNHPGQLPPPLHPQVSAKTVLSPQLLEAHVVGRAPGAGHSGLCSPEDRAHVPFTVTAACGPGRHRSHVQFGREEALHGVPTLEKQEGGGVPRRCPRGPVRTPGDSYPSECDYVQTGGSAKRFICGSLCKLPYDLNFVIM